MVLMMEMAVIAMMMRGGDGPGDGGWCDGVTIVVIMVMVAYVVSAVSSGRVMMSWFLLR